MRKLGAMLGVFCVATVLAEAIALGYFLGTGRLSRDRLARIIAVAHGLELLPATPAVARSKRGDASVGFDEMSDAMTMRSQQLDMREQILEGHRLRLDTRQQAFQAEKDQFLAARAAFQQQLDEWEKGEKAQALDEAVLLLSKLRPDQAKAQLLLMLQRGEMDSVVTLMRQLPADRQAKIAGEFTTPDENEKLGEILRRIRQGEPRVPLAEKSRNVLKGQ